MGGITVFSDILRNSKIKYRIRHDKDRNVDHPAQLDPENGERELYQGDSRKIHLASQSDLNLYMVWPFGFMPINMWGLNPRR